MSDSLSEPLSDVGILQRLLVQRDTEIARQSAELLARDLLIEKLKLQLANLRRHRFGSKSEALDQIIDQLELALEEAEIAASRKHHNKFRNLTHCDAGGGSCPPHHKRKYRF